MFFAFALVSLVIWIVSEFSEPFSNFFNRYVSSFFRGMMAMLTNFIPFSVAECIIISLPVLFVIVIVLCVRATKKGNRAATRYIVSLASIAALMYGMFVMTTAVAYNSSTLDKKLGLEQKKVSVDELKETAEYMIEKMNEDLDDVKFRYAGSSVMPYSVSEMNDKLPDEVKEGWYKQIPLRRGGTPEDVAKVALFLASDLSSYVSGQVIHCCGAMNC